MTDDWRLPQGSTITEAEARALVSGPYGKACARFTISCRVPLFWFQPADASGKIIDSGTVTLVRPSRRTFGVTAAHVIRGFQADLERQTLGTVLGDADIGNLASRVIDVSDKLDLATIDLDDGILERLGPGWSVFPLSLWPPKPPLENFGISMGGFPAGLRQNHGPRRVAFAPWTVLSVARGVSDDQIAWKFDRAYLASPPDDPSSVAPTFELGGISGGPLLRVEERAGRLVGLRLAGIISEARPEYEYIVAKRADFIRDDGSIMVADAI